MVRIQGLVKVGFSPISYPMDRRRDSTDWMWAQACDMLAQAERKHRQFFRLGSARQQPRWEPPVDVFEDASELVIVVAMPGVEARAVNVAVQPGVLLVRGTRFLPATERHAIRQLEIPHGHFERRIALPAALLELVSNELVDGCLTLHFRKIG